MSNKTDLQANNTDLQEILQAVQDLPQASHWSGGGTIIPGTADVDIPAYTDTELVVQGDMNLVPSNIASGVSIFGVSGSANIAPMKITIGSFTFQGEVGGSIDLSLLTVNHGLGVRPSLVIAYSKSVGYLDDDIFLVPGVLDSDTENCIQFYGNVSHGGSIGTYSGALNSSQFQLCALDMTIGSTYNWIAIA